MALTDQERIDIRRYCGYPVYGEDVPVTFFYIYTERYMVLEQRLSYLSDDEETTLRAIYLVNIRKLESDLMLTTDNLDTDTAAVWKHNSNEGIDRMNLYNSWRIQLCSFLGIAPLFSSGGNVKLQVA